MQLYEKLFGARANEEARWQEIAERFWPSQSRMFNGGRFGRTAGEKRNQYAFDSTPITAVNRCTAILDSLLNPHNQRWHRLKATDDNLMKDRETRLYFEQATDALFKLRYAPLANFIGQNQLSLKMMVAFGTGTLLADHLRNIRKQKTGIRYKSIHLAEVFFRENHQGIIDTAVRHYPQTARQLVQDWGNDPLPTNVLDAFKSEPDKEFWCIHIVQPREDYDPERADHKGMPFSSEYILVGEKWLLDEGGYRTFPYPTARWEKDPNSVYAYSPADEALPSAKVLNEQKKTVLKQGHRAVDPVLLAHDDGVVDTFQLRPGAVNAGGVNADGRPLVHALPVGNIAVGQDMMDVEKAAIQDPFLITMFQILVENPQMTATEVMERVKEKNIFLSPTMGRQYSERYTQLIDRELDLAFQLGKLPPLPRALQEAGGEYEITFESPLTRTQRAEEAAGFMRALEVALNYAQQMQDPSPLDHFNMDEIIPELADIHGMPAKWRRSLQEVEAIREGRATQAEEEKAIAAAPGAAAMIKAGAVAQEKARTA